MLLLLLLSLLKDYTEDKNVECLALKQKWKNVPNRFKQWFKGTTWLKKQVFVYTIWTDNARTPESAETYPNVGKYYSISVPSWICLNMRETLRAYISQSSKYAWIYLLNVQNMHTLFLNNPWITCLKLTKYVYDSEYAWISHARSEYAIIYMNTSNCARMLNMPTLLKYTRM